MPVSKLTEIRPASTGTEANITAATTYGWAGELALSTDSGILFAARADGDPFEPVCGIISRTTGIDATATGTTELYAVPTGRTLIIAGIVIRVTAFTSGSKSVQAVASIGGNSATYDDYLNSVTYTVTGADNYLTDRAADSTEIATQAAGDSVRVSIETASDATTETWAIDLLGYLV